MILNLTTSGFCQIPTRPFIINYNSQDYNADFQNWSVSIANNKTVYIGNNLGLLEFDGANWSLHKMPDQLIVRSVHASREGRIYVGAYEEFGYWRKNRFGELDYFSLSDSIPAEYFHNDEIWRIIPYHNKIYFQSFSSIFIYDGKGIDIIHPGFTIVLLQKANDRLFIHGVNRGLFEIVDNELLMITQSKFLADDEIKVVMPYDDQRLVIGASQNGLFIFDGQKFEPWNFFQKEEVKKAGVNIGIRINDQFILGTIANGIYIIKKNGDLAHHLNTANQLMNNTVLSLELDRNGNFWAAFFGGISYVELDNDLSFYFDQKGELGSVFSAAIHEGSLWVGSNRGLYKFDSDPEYGFVHPELIENSQGPVWTLHVMDGELWCGHNNGTYKIKNNRMIEVSEHNGGYAFGKISRNGHEFLIQSTYSPLVVYKRSRNSWEYSHTITGFLEPINFFEIDFQGNLWGNHATKGIFRIKLNETLDSVRSYQYIGEKEGLPTERNLFVAKIENRIVFTTGQLIYTYDDLTDTIIPYAHLNRQVNEYSAARRIIHIRDNHYWFVLPEKIGWFTFNDQVATRKYEYILNQRGAYLNVIFPKISILNEHMQLICLENGFALLDENKIYHQANVPIVNFERIETWNNKNREKLWPLYTAEPIKIKYENRNIRFTFSTDERTKFPKFRTFLEGLENEWNPWTDESSINYTRLPYGKYSFKLKSISYHGAESKLLSYPFIIQPPWYATKIATASYILSVLIFGLLLRIAFLKRLKNQSEKLAIKEKENREKERLAAERKYIRLKNDSLQSEIRHQNIQLANRAMAIIQKNELISKIKKELKELQHNHGKEISQRHLNELFIQIDRTIQSENEWNEFEVHFDQANQNFFKRLKEAYPDLTSNDLRLCAYLRMNLSSKEIAPLLNISLRGVEIKRYRLRKRLNLDTEENLIDFLITF